MDPARKLRGPFQNLRRDTPLSESRPALHKIPQGLHNMRPIAAPACSLSAAPISQLLALPGNTRTFSRQGIAERLSVACYAGRIRTGDRNAVESAQAASGPVPSESSSVVRASEGMSPAPALLKLQGLLSKVTKAAAVGALCFALACSSVSPALAARSAGRMGGSSFAGRGSSVGGSMGSRGMGGGFGGFSGQRGYGLGSPGLTGPGMSARRGPSVSINSFGWFGPPGLYGGGYGYGVPATTGGGGGFGNILLLGVLAAVLWTAFTSYSGGADGADSYGERATVVKLQVGLLGSARQIQRDLERIADRANPNSAKDLNYILQETVLALMRNPDYCVYGEASTSNKNSLGAAETAFNQLSMAERGKFKQETLVNVGSVRKSSRLSGGSSGRSGTNELIVVTVLAGVAGGIKLPKVRSLEDLRSALGKLGSVSKENTLAVEVMWTPQDEDDYYTRDDLLEDYPTLNNL